MLNIKLWQKNKLNFSNVYKNSLLMVSLFIATLFLRLVFLDNIEVNFDQIQIIKAAEEILVGNLTLIGPRTGPAAMFTGPLIYYLAAPIVFLFGNLYAIPVISALIALVTAIVLFFLTKKYFDEKTAFIVLVFYTFSPFLVNFDRVLWNPNLVFLATILILIPSLKPNASRFTYLWLILGGFLTYQAHFSGFVLLFLGLCILFFSKDKKFKLMATLFFGFLLSLLPTVIFDLRNNFLNTKGFLNLIFGENKSVSLPLSINNAVSFFLRLKENLLVVLRIIGELFIGKSSTTLVFSLAILFIILLFVYLKKDFLTKITFFWSVIIIILYSFYSHDRPEYYFLILAPCFLLLMAKLIAKLKNKIFYFGLLVFIFVTIGVNFQSFPAGYGISIKNIYLTQKYLNDKKISQIIYDMPYGYQFGIEYYLNKINFTEDGLKAHVIYPNNNNYSNVYKINKSFGVWLDNRDYVKKNYVTKDDYILSINKKFELLQSYPIDNIAGNQEKYLIENKDNKTIIGSIDIVNLADKESEFVNNCRLFKEKADHNWLKLTNKKTYFFSNNYCLLINLDSDSNITTDNLEINLE